MAAQGIDSPHIEGDASAEIEALEARAKDLRRARKALKAAARMKALHADPEFKAQAAARMKALHADRKNKLPPLSREQSRVYTKLRAVVGRDAALAEAIR